MMKRILRTITLLSMLLMMVGCCGATAEINMPESVQVKESIVAEESDDLESEVEEAEKEEIEIETDIIKLEPD